MPVSDKPSRNRLYAALFIGVAVVAFVAFVFDALSSAGRLELYTSPAITVKGRTIRVQILKPFGWHADEWRSEIQDKEKSYTIMLREPPGGVGIVSSTKGLFGIEHREPGYVAITVPLSPDYKLNDIDKDPDGHAFYGIKGDPGGQIQYLCSEKDRFESTYKLVCKSFKVISD